MNERDPELDKLYREHAREEPPSALDAKILAAAHRAVESGPRKVGEATRPQRWWMPLAAAAVIGVVAVGIVQQMPKEPAIDATSVAPAQAPMQAPAQAPVPATVESRPAADAEVLQKKQKEADAPAPAAPPPPAATAKLAAPKAAPPPRPAPEPFPASPPAPQPLPQKTEAASMEAKRDAPAEQSFADARKDNAARAERQAPMTAAAPAPPPAPAAAPAMAARMRAQGESAGAIAQLGKNVQDEMQELARDPDAWIARIRKLRDAGNTEQALRELKEFRARVPDAERRLPADLKSLQP